MSNTKPLTKEAIDEIAKKSFTDYIAGRRDSRGNPTPAPAECPASTPAKCKACDGSRRQGGWGDISDTPCPCCWPAPEKCATCRGLGRSVPHKPECPDINEPQFGEAGGLLFCGKCETMRDICPACRGTGRKP